MSNVNQLSEDEVPARTEEANPPLGLSWFVAVPLVAMSLILVLEGFSGAITTPYLNETYDISISQGSMYVLVQYIGLIAGATTSGSILQLAWLSTSKVMAAGSFLGMIGVILVFPGERIRFLHSSVP